jgi:hypothetical protein
MFVSVTTDLTDMIKPTYYSSCVCECVIGFKPSKSKILTICPIQAQYNHEDSPEKETCSLTATITQIIPENHKIIPKNPWD